MGAYKKIVITDTGNALLAKVVAGQTTLKFSKSRISSHIYPDGTDFKKMTSLQDVKHEAIPSNVNVINDTTVLARVLFGNENVSEKYLIQNIGLYALDGEKEILFSVSQAVTPDEMPVYNGVAPSSFIYDISIPVAQAATINLTVDPAGTATVKDIIDLDEKKVDASGGDISSTVTTVEEPASAADKYPEINGQGTVKATLGKLLRWVKSLKADKVDKESGKGLSTNDYTDAEKKALAGKVDEAGGDIANTKVASLQASTAQYPVLAAGDTTKAAFGKIKKFSEDIRNWMTGVCLIGQIVNNCVTNRADLPLSAAQGKVLMDLYNVLNANSLKNTEVITQYNKICIRNVKIQYGKMECLVDFNGNASLVFPDSYKSEDLYCCIPIPMSGAYAVRSVTNVGANNSLVLLMDNDGNKPEYHSKIWMQYIVMGA